MTETEVYDMHCMGIDPVLCTIEDPQHPLYGEAYGFDVRDEKDAVVVLHYQVGLLTVEVKETRFPKPMPLDVVPRASTEFHLGGTT